MVTAKQITIIALLLSVSALILNAHYDWNLFSFKQGILFCSYAACGGTCSSGSEKCVWDTDILPPGYEHLICTSGAWMPYELCPNGCSGSTCSSGGGGGGGGSASCTDQYAGTIQHGNYINTACCTSSSCTRNGQTWGNNYYGHFYCNNGNLEFSAINCGGTTTTTTTTIQSGCDDQYTGHVAIGFTFNTACASGTTSRNGFTWGKDEYGHFVCTSSGWSFSKVGCGGGSQCSVEGSVCGSNLPNCCQGSTCLFGTDLQWKCRSGGGTTTTTTTSPTLTCTSGQCIDTVHQKCWNDKESFNTACCGLDDGCGTWFGANIPFNKYLNVVCESSNLKADEKDCGARGILTAKCMFSTTIGDFDVISRCEQDSGCGILGQVGRVTGTSALINAIASLVGYQFQDRCSICEKLYTACKTADCEVNSNILVKPFCGVYANLVAIKVLYGNLIFWAVLIIGVLAILVVLSIFTNLSVPLISNLIKRD